MAIPRNLSNLAPGADTSGVLGVAKGGTGTSTAFTSGSVVFSGTGGTYTQDNANLFFDDTNNRLGVGTASPASTMDINGGAAQNVVAVSASAVDCSTGNYFTKTASGALTWTFTNVPASRSFIFALQLTNGGSGTQTWPAAVSWNGGTAPTLQTSGTDILIFVTSNSGTTWRGVRAWKQA